MKGKIMPKIRKKKGAELYAEKVEKGINKKRNAFVSNLKLLITHEPVWGKSSKNYFFYDKCFKVGFGKGLIDVLKNLPKNRKRPLRIIEDGAGNGNCLSSIKIALTKEGINSEVIALSLTDLPELKEKKKTKLIDKLFVGLAESFVPKKPVDAIISINGSIHTTIPFIRKNHLLKFAYSLKKGGIMLIRFTENKGLSREANENRKISVLKETKGIERAFAKRGFKAKFHYISSSVNLRFNEPMFRVNSSETKVKQLNNLTFKQALNPAFILAIKRIK